MTQAHADNPKPLAPAKGEALPNLDNSLEDRIDSLLSEMQESLDELGIGDDSPDEIDALDPDDASPPDADDQEPTDPIGQAEPEGAPPADRLPSLEEAVDDALAAASRAVQVEPPSAPPKDESPAPPAPEVAPAPREETETGAPAETTASIETDEPAPATDTAESAPSAPMPAGVPDPAGFDAQTAEAVAPPIEKLDEELARRERTRNPPEDAAPETPRATSNNTVASPSIDNAPAPSETSESAEENAKPQGEKPKVKISIRRGPKPASDGASTPSEPTTNKAEATPNTEPATAAPAPSPTPARTRGSASPPLERVLSGVSVPLRFMPPGARDYVGWFGLLTAFNGLCVWLFWLLLRA